MILFPFETYCQINKVISDKAEWGEYSIVPVKVPIVDDVIKNEIAASFKDYSDERFLIWASLNIMFQGFHVNEWPAANACIFGLLGVPVNAAILDAPPLEAIALFTGYSGVIARNISSQVILNDDVMNYIKGIAWLMGTSYCRLPFHSLPMKTRLKISTSTRRTMRKRRL
jgi:hypothetical protein